jgi:hypothetical protein
LILQFLESRRQPLGGWQKIGASKRAGTNPTAVAAASLLILKPLDESKDTERVATASDFL